MEPHTMQPGDVGLCQVSRHSAICERDLAPQGIDSRRGHMHHRGDKKSSVIQRAVHHVVVTQSRPAFDVEIYSQMCFIFRCKPHQPDSNPWTTHRSSICIQLPEKPCSRSSSGGVSRNAAWTHAPGVTSWAHGGLPSRSALTRRCRLGRLGRK